jgi:hypothetical protein
MCVADGALSCNDTSILENLPDEETAYRGYVPVGKFDMAMVSMEPVGNPVNCPQVRRLHCLPACLPACLLACLLLACLPVSV